MPDTDATLTSSQEESKLDQQATDAGTQTAKPESTPEKTFTQDELTRIVKKELAAAKAKAEKAAAEAEAKEKGEYEALSKQYSTELTALKAEHETLVADHQITMDLLQSILKQSVKDLPEPIRKLAPTNPKDLVPWLKDAKELAASIEKPEMPNNQRGPKPAGGADALAASKNALLASHKYNSL